MIKGHAMKSKKVSHTNQPTPQPKSSKRVIVYEVTPEEFTTPPIDKEAPVYNCKKQEPLKEIPKK